MKIALIYRSQYSCENSVVQPHLELSVLKDKKLYLVAFNRTFWSHLCYFEELLNFSVANRSSSNYSFASNIVSVHCYVVKSVNCS